MKFLDHRAVLRFSFILVFVNAVVDESEDYARFFNEPQTMPRDEGPLRRSNRPIKGSSSHASPVSFAATTEEEQTLQEVEFERKEAPAISKVALKFAREDWRDRLVFSDRPTTVPSESPTNVPTKEPSESPSMIPSQSISPTNNDTVVPGQLMVGAYYYPWHADDFHRGYGYLREDLEPPQLPELGEYDDRDRKTIWKHLRWSRQANINLWITSWWGPQSRSDNTTREFILTHDTLRTHKISVFYETQGRIRESDDYSLHRVERDMKFLCDNYFRHPNYYNVDDVGKGRRPVLFLYLSRGLDNRGLLRATTERMRQGVRDSCGKELYIVGDQVFGGTAEKDFVNNPRHYSAFQLLDAVTNYDVYGSVAQIVGRKGGTLTQSQVQNYYENEQAEWKAAAERYNCQFIPAVSPGYNDLSVRPRAANPPLSRSLQGQEPGSLFREALKYAVPLADNSGLDSTATSQPDRLLVVNSLNEWHEDTQIEPTVGTASSTPINHTFGFTYEGYGTKYLDILKEATDSKLVV
ncbi:unnamed protein product [Cylindrotheca closterium]|uniref:Uncharacterized protein n=1 Tax=Cylindrotheca closterium TaxID=2856 RepID=A0AAD2FNM0_9STRA|nr:unnamed protein product [Cylindrotheca closterium]